MAVSALRGQTWLGKTNKNQSALWQNIPTDNKISSSLHSLTHQGHGRGVFGGGGIKEEGAFGIQYCLVHFDPYGFHAYPSLPPLALEPPLCSPSNRTIMCKLCYVPCIYSTYVCYIHSGWKITYSTQLELTEWTVAQNKGIMNGQIHYYLMLPHTANYSHNQLM